MLQGISHLYPGQKMTIDVIVQDNDLYRQRIAGSEYLKLKSDFKNHCLDRHILNQSMIDMPPDYANRLMMMKLNEE